MTDYVIEQYVPVPKKRSRAGRKNGCGFLVAARTLKVGDSFLAKPIDQFSVSAVGRHYGFKLISRNTDEGLRIWRTA